MREYLLCAFAAATVTYLATAAVRRFAIRFGAIAAVRERDVHTLPTPRMGGLAIFFGIVVALVFASQLPLMQTVFQGPTQTAGWLFASMIVLVAVGMVDDRWGLDAVTKFAGQVLAAGILAFGGISVAWLPIGGVFVLDPWTSVLVTVFIVVLTVNSMNFVDGLDGLAAGIAAISASAFFAYSYLLSVVEGFDRATLSTLVSAALCRRLPGLPAAQLLPGAALHGRHRIDADRADAGHQHDHPAGPGGSQCDRGRDGAAGPAAAGAAGGRARGAAGGPRARPSCAARGPAIRRSTRTRATCITASCSWGTRRPGRCC